MKKTILLLCALLLAGCSHREELSDPSAPPAPPSPASTAATTPPDAAGSAVPTATPVPDAYTPAPALPVTAGIYRWDGGEFGEWTLNLKDNGTFSVIGPERIYNGEGWSDNGDGSVTTGPTEAAGAAPFFDEFGSSLWRVSGETCEPVY